MSDASQGEGWWVASDGKWYPPELYPADWPRPAAGSAGGVDTSIGTPAGADTHPAQSPPRDADPWTRPLEPPGGASEAAEPVSRSRGAGPDLVSAVIGLAGAGLLIVGSLLDWATVTGDDLSGAVNGLTGSNGWGTLIAGGAVGAGVVLLVLGQRRWFVGAAVMLAAAVAAGLAGFSIVDIDGLSDDLPGLLVDEGIPPQAAATAGLDLALGIWLASAGAAMALVSGLLALIRHTTTTE